MRDIMKTLGLIGGLSWFSTTVYYRKINELVNERLGGAHSAKLLLYSVDFNEFKVLQERDDWDQVAAMLIDIARRLEAAGADCIVMCTNTPHLVADQIRQEINIPLIHIAEETAKAISDQAMHRVGLIGTKFTMESSFFKGRLTAAGIETLVPDDEDRDFIHSNIFNELTRGIFADEARQRYLEIIDRLGTRGAEGVVFGCTEISLLVNKSDSSLPVFDTTEIHARAAVDFALFNAAKQSPN